MCYFTALVTYSDAQTPTSTPNPECNGMNAAAGQLKRGINLVLRKNAQCAPNQHCTGDCILFYEHVDKSIVNNTT